MTINTMLNTKLTEEETLYLVRLLEKEKHHAISNENKHLINDILEKLRR